MGRRVSLSIPRPQMNRTMSMPSFPIPGSRPDHMDLSRSVGSTPDLGVSLCGPRGRGILKHLTLGESLDAGYGTCSSTSLSSDESRRSVSFQSIEIREYKRIVGDNPSVTNGPPISLGWDVENSHIHKFEEYELVRSLEREGSQGFLLSRDKREKLLMENGCTRKDIASSVRNVVRAKNKRRTTVTNLGRSTVVEEIFENAFRKFKKVVGGNRKDLNYQNFVSWSDHVAAARRAEFLNLDSQSELTEERLLRDARHSPKIIINEDDECAEEKDEVDNDQSKSNEDGLFTEEDKETRGANVHSKSNANIEEHKNDLVNDPVKVPRTSILDKQIEAQQEPRRGFVCDTPVAQIFPRGDNALAA